MIFALNRTEVQMSTPFLRVTSWFFCTHVYCAPAERFANVFFFSHPKMWGLLRPKYPPKMQKPKGLAEKTKKQKKTKNLIRWRLGRGTLNTCKISGSNFKKRRGHWRLKVFWDFMHGPACNYFDTELTFSVIVSGGCYQSVIYIYKRGCYTSNSP